jgi:hypothetical protein
MKRNSIFERLPELKKWKFRDRIEIKIGDRMSNPKASVHGRLQDIYSDGTILLYDPKKRTLREFFLDSEYYVYRFEPTRTGFYENLTLINHTLNEKEEQEKSMNIQDQIRKRMKLKHSILSVVPDR